MVLRSFRDSPLLSNSNNNRNPSAHIYFITIIVLVCCWYTNFHKVYDELSNINTNLSHNLRMDGRGRVQTYPPYTLYDATIYGREVSGMSALHSLAIGYLSLFRNNVLRIHPHLELSHSL